MQDTPQNQPSVGTEPLATTSSTRHQRSFWIISCVLISILGVVLLAGIYIFRIWDKVAVDKAEVNKDGSTLRDGMDSIKVPGEIFISRINKPLSKVDYMDLPNNREIRNVVEYKDSVFTAGNGSIVRYSKDTGEVMSFSDAHKVYCDGELAVIADYLYAACRIDNINDAFGTAKIEKTKFYSGHIGLLKINLNTYQIEKVFTKEDGLANQYNYQLYPDGIDLWIGTFDGVARINTKSDKVTFFHDELGYPDVNQSYGVRHILIDKEHIWAFFGSNNQSQGGVALYTKKTSTWQPFGPTDLMEKPNGFDLSFTNGYLAKLVQGGIQIAFRDTKLDNSDRLVEKKYTYSTGEWEIVGEHPYSGPEAEQTYTSMREAYPSIQYEEMDSRGLTQIFLPSDGNRLNIDGRVNYLLSPVIGDKRFVLTNGTVDLFQANAPFRQILVYLEEELSFASSLGEGMQEAMGYKFLVDPDTSMSLIIDYTCGGMTCVDSQRVWFADLANKKISKVYTGSDLPTELLESNELKLTIVGKIVKVSLDSGSDIFEVDTSTNKFKLLTETIEGNEQSPTSITKATLTSTDGWKEVKLDGISFMVPTQVEVSPHPYPETCQHSFDRCYKIKNIISDTSPWGVEIAVKDYAGGSRRDEANLEGTYTFRELDFGTRNGLEATFVCQVDGCTATRRVLFVVGNKLVSLLDGIYLDKSKGDGTAENPYTSSLESPITNTIISTVK